MLKKEREQISFIQKTLVVRKGEYTISLGYNSPSFCYSVSYNEMENRVDTFWHNIPKELWFDHFASLGENLVEEYDYEIRVFLYKLAPETLLDKEEWQHLTLKEIFDSLDTVERLNGERD